MSKRRKNQHDKLPSIEVEALAGPDGPPPRRLTPEWIAVQQMDITAHLMAAFDKTARQLDRIGDAAEDAMAHATRIASIRKPLAVVALVAALLAAAFGVYQMGPRLRIDRGNVQAVEHGEIRLGGVTYRVTRREFEQRLSTAAPEPVHKYFVEVGGRRFAVKQAVSVGVSAPRASFDSSAAIHALTKLGYVTQEITP